MHHISGPLRLEQVRFVLRRALCEGPQPVALSRVVTRPQESRKVHILHDVPARSGRLHISGKFENVLCAQCGRALARNLVGSQWRPGPCNVHAFSC